jgi:hypothetical protein
MKPPVGKSEASHGCIGVVNSPIGKQNLFPAPLVSFETQSQVSSLSSGLTQSRHYSRWTRFRLPNESGFG